MIELQYMKNLFPCAFLVLSATAALPAYSFGQDAPAEVKAQPASDPAAAAAARRAARPAGARRAGPAPAAAPAAAPLQQVQVNASRLNETETRRESTAAKMIFGREELDRNGDSNVGEILKRLPGVTMGGPPGRGGRGGGGGVRMRGLGNGYTQMLVNGERPPAGFSLESLSPDQVERIEIMRGPVAEFSTQAIAGTINIVLREGYRQQDIQLRVGDSVEQGLHSPNVSVTVPGKKGNLTWIMTSSVGQNRNKDANVTEFDEVRNDGVLLRDQTRTSESESRGRNLHLAPRLSYRFDNGDTLNFQPFLVSGRNHGTSISTQVDRVNPASTDYAVALGTNEGSQTFLRGFGNWLHKMDEGARIDVKFGFGLGENEGSSTRREFNRSGAAADVFTYSDSGRNRGLNSGGKYTRPMGKGHLLAVGWDAEAGTRSQSATSLRNGSPQFPESGENLTAETRRLAIFAQDEWDITPKWGVYLGLRWEGIATSANNRGRETESTTSVWSPVIHTVWRLPGKEKDQIRASFTQSYKAPQLNDLIAIPTFSPINDATRPDRSGNPDLKPELAKGFDLAYEHYIGKNGIVSASAFYRKIDNLMRRRLFERQTDQGLRWLSTPSNIGSARTSGIELEAKLQLSDLMEDAPNIDLRANYSHFWSSVDGIPGPDNRLDQQARQTANVGFDYRMKAQPLSFGGSYNWTPATNIQTSLNERVRAGVKRQFDAYALLKQGANNQLRFSVSNILAEDYLNGATIRTADRAQISDTTVRTYPTFSVRLEMKL